MCSKKAFAPGEEHVIRIHERSVLILMISGELRFLEGGREVVLTAGEYYIQMQDIFQDAVPISDPPVYYYVEFYASFSEKGTLPLRGKFDTNIIEPIIIELMHSDNVFSQNALLNRLFAQLCSELSLGSSIAHKIKRFISSNYSKPLSLNEIASEFGYTADHVTRLFKRKYGTTPHKHLVNVRLEHAMWLLTNTSLTTERICEVVGYTDFSSFWRAFKRKYSCSPGDVRRELKEKDEQSKI